MTIKTRYTPEDFASHLVSAIHVGEKIETLSVRVEELARAFKEISQKIDRIATSDGQLRLLYTTREAAQMLSVSIQTVRLMMAQGYLPCTKANSRLQRIHRKDLEALAKIGIPSVWERNKPWKEERKRGGQ